MQRKIEVENAPNPATPEQRARLPSENAPAPATRSYTVPQQASTSPGDGSEVHANQVPFKEQVIGVAKVTRGTILHKASLKQEGEAILEGQITQEDMKSTSDL